MKRRCFAALTTLLVFLCASALAGIEITEVVSKNVTLRLDENGLAHDYVVIANTGSEPVDMDGYTLTDGGKDAYEFDGVTLKPGDSITVYCTGEEPNAPFKLAAEGETLYLYDKDGGFVQTLSVPPMGDNQIFKGGSIVEGEFSLAQDGLVISELLAVNTLLVIDDKTPDFVELHNMGTAEMNLSGYGLSDNSGKPGKWVFPDTVIPAGGYLAVYLTEDKGFGLSGDGECVMLTDPSGKIVDFVSFGAQQNDVALALMDGEMKETYTPTPGEANVITSKTSHQQAVYAANATGLIINEVVASNGTFDTNGNAFDYVELYNAGKKSIALSEFSVSDSALDLFKWTFPKGAKLSPGAYAIVYMAGREITSGKPNTYYAGFKISKTNSAILLSRQGDVVDKVSLGRQYGNIAYGRVHGQGAFFFFEQQTQRAKNPDIGFEKRTGDVAISKPGGIYHAPVSVALTADKGAVIRYTLDGSTPTESSPAYEGPIAISQNTALRARAFLEGELSSNTSSAAYLFGIQADVPVVSLITDKKYLTEESTGLFAKGYGQKANYAQEWEYPIHVQYIENGKLVIDQLSSFRTTGGLGLTRPQKTISIFARGALGPDRFYFNPFSSREYASYNALTLRSGGTESRGTRFKDELLTSLAQGLNVMYQDARPVVVYINGQYWGHYNLREKINQDSIAQWEGVTDEAVIDNITILRSRGTIVKGDRKEINELIRFCTYQDLNVPENLQFVTDRLDVMSYFDHAILEIITGNADMHNVRYYKVPGGKWKLALFDLDGCMDDLRMHPLDLYLKKATEKMDRFFHEPFAALMKVPAMRDLFLRRFGEILYQKFLPGDLLAKIAVWESAVGPLMPDHVKRWPDTSLERWKKYVDQLKQFAKERPVKMVEHMTREFQLTEDQVVLYFGDFLHAVGK